MKLQENFYDKVYDIVKRIPAGKVSTYGAIAKAAGMKSSARMVGWALNAAKNLSDIPFHRVVNRNGELTGKIHFSTPDFMEEMLKSEGVKFRDKAVDMKRHFWEPKVENQKP